MVDLLPVGGADAEWDLFLMRGAREAREHLPFINYSRDGGESQGTHGDFKGDHKIFAVSSVGMEATMLQGGIGEATQA